MASFRSMKSGVFDREERKLQYQSYIRGLNAYDRHKKFVKDYVDFYGKEKMLHPKLPVKTDHDTLREGYRFIFSEEDDVHSSWEKRLVKRYYDKLFKEYCIADMSYYKKGKIGLRWRTEKEVMSGKGQFVCGNRECDERSDLGSYEVNFSYHEAGEEKQALAKLVACKRCGEKLVYKRMKDKEREKAKENDNLKKKREREERESSSGDDYDVRNRRRKGNESLSSGRRKSDDKEGFEEFLEGMFP